MGMLCKFVMQRTIIFSNLTDNLGKGFEDAHHQAEQASEHKLVLVVFLVKKTPQSQGGGVWTLVPGGPKFSDHARASATGR